MSPAPPDPAGTPAWTPRFLSAAVHELRTPLSSLLLTAEMLAGDARLEPRQARFAGALHEAANDLRALLDDLGELNRLVGGRVQAHVAPLRLPDVLAEVAIELREALAERGASWEVMEDDAAPREVSSDPVWLQRIAERLARSALAAGARRLGWRVAPATGGAVTLALADDGEPPQARDLGALFEPFAPAGARVKRPHGGSGLGLAIAAAAAHLLGGTLAASAGDGETRLVLTLPPAPPTPGGAG
jgi:signal transduction histidine kinase